MVITKKSVYGLEGLIKYDHPVKFLFRAKSMKGEGNPFDVPRSRLFSEVNMLFVMALNTELQIDLF